MTDAPMLCAGCSQSVGHSLRNSVLWDELQACLVLALLFESVTSHAG